MVSWILETEVEVHAIDGFSQTSVGIHIIGCVGVFVGSEFFFGCYFFGCFFSNKCSVGCLILSVIPISMDHDC